MITKDKALSYGILIGSLLCTAILIVLDRWSKVFMKAWLQAGSKVVIPKVLSFSYVENTGAAFNMLDQQRVLFLIIAFVASVFIILGMIKMTKTKEESDTLRGSLWIFRIFCVLVLAGAIGNAIDRLIQGYVIDFIHVTFINFPVFNLADCYVVIGCGILLLMAVFRKGTLDDIERSLFPHGRKE